MSFTRLWNIFWEYRDVLLAGIKVTIALSILSMLLGIAAAVWMGARIYRVGILMHGKRPTFAEMARWIRAS